ncbi:alanine/glycine:cation symporter family protein [Priestia megaterium]|uniref:alanine/glycine:cation symporter family protein n=1 Tax=Priestia megaterium TaxID=1404 RepID=UPI003D9E1784
MISTISEMIWSTPMLYLCIGVGLLFTILTRFVQVRYLKDMVTLLFNGKSSESGVSSFQALTLALSGRVGVGNIAGVATAIAFGGPRAVFWMWFIAFIGSASAFIESTLAQIYKVKDKGEYRGVPACYIEKGMGKKWYALIFAFAVLLAMSVLGPGVQANSITAGLNNAFSIPPLTSGIVLVVILGLIIFGGVKRIAAVVKYVVPFMAIGYVLVSLVIIGLNIQALPGVLALVFKSAFALDSTFGGIIGMAIAWGVKRGVYSNEAGQGTGAHPAGAAEVSHPAKQGLVQAFSVYIDTLLVCSATAFMILITGSYSTQAPDGSFIVDHLKGVEAGPQYTQQAVETVLPGFGSGFVAVSLVFFAFTTIMSQYYIAETNLAYVMKGKQNKIVSMFLKAALLATTLYGSIRTAEAAWVLADIGVGIIVWLNLIAILILAKPALITLKDYRQQRKLGIDPIFSPRKLGIQNADYWHEEYQHDQDKENVS